jgi:hypothetical protein
VAAPELVDIRVACQHERAASSAARGRPARCASRAAIAPPRPTPFGPIPIPRAPTADRA